MSSTRLNTTDVKTGPKGGCSKGLDVDIFSLEGGCSKGLDAFILFLNLQSYSGKLYSCLLLLVSPAW